MEFGGVAGTRAASDYETLERIATLTDEQEAALQRGDLFLATLLGEMAAPAAAAATHCAPPNALWAAALHEHATELRGRVRYAVTQRQTTTYRAPATAAYTQATPTPRRQGQGLGWYA